MQREIKIWSDIECWSIEGNEEYTGKLSDAPDYIKTYIIRASVLGKTANIAMPLKEADPLFMLDRLIESIKNNNNS